MATNFLDAATNFAKASLSTGYNASATSIVVSAGGSLFPAPPTDKAFNVVWWNSTDYADPADDPTVEIVRCTARSGNTFTVVRGQEGTAAVTHNTSGKTYRLALALTKKTIEDIDGKVYNLIRAAFRATQSAPQSIPGSTETLLQFNTETFDLGTEYDNAAYRFEAITAGYYQFTASLLFTSPTAAYYDVRLRKNGTTFSSGSTYLTGTGNTAVSVTDIVYLAAGDYVDVAAWQTTAGSLNTNISSSLTFFCGHAVGV